MFDQCDPLQISRNSSCSSRERPKWGHAQLEECRYPEPRQAQGGRAEMTFRLSCAMCSFCRCFYFCRQGPVHPYSRHLARTCKPLEFMPQIYGMQMPRTAKPVLNCISQHPTEAPLRCVVGCLDVGTSKNTYGTGRALRRQLVLKAATLEFEIATGTEHKTSIFEP